MSQQIRVAYALHDQAFASYAREFGECVALKNRAHITGKQLAAFLREADSAGVETKQVLDILGHASLSGVPTKDDDHLSLVDFFRIEGEIARRLDDLTAHLSERKLTFETGAFVTTQMDRATTLCEAVTALAKHFNMMHGEHYNTVRITERTVTLIISDDEFPYTLKDDADMVSLIGECVLIKVQCLLDSLSDGLAGRALRRVTVKRTSPVTLPGHLLFWEAPLSFGQSSYELSFDHELAHSPIPKTGNIDLSSEGIFSRVIGYLERRKPNDEGNSFKTRTLDLVRAGITQQDAIAHQLSVSVATLRRRLEEEATSFRQLINEHRLDEATSLLRKGLSVARVSEQLNYSDIRAFNRAFKRWKGETPAKYAQRHVAAEIPA